MALGRARTLLEISAHSDEIGHRIRLMAATDSDWGSKSGDIVRNRWPTCFGFPGRHRSESLADMPRIMQDQEKLEAQKKLENVQSPTSRVHHKKIAGHHLSRKKPPNIIV